ncbi:RNA polymerase sigma factor [Nocardia sp. NPDC020380]|uniref:RNA polymerase sigma factor n=1 Tax=Nocardia sp. NPDC020380 TaxID=3364309 RepID=UPI003789524C
MEYEPHEPEAHGSDLAAEEVSAGRGPDAAEVALVARAVSGDRDAISDVVRVLQDPIYRLALRMVWRPADAEDATQEILLRVAGNLASWRGEAKLLTWAYRVGVNYLLNLKRQSPQEATQVSLDEFGESLKDGLAAEDYRGPEAELLTHETRLNCTQAMLQCLAREERVAYVLSEVFGLSSAEAAWIADTTPAAHRKRLERAKKRLGNFLTKACGLANPQAFCRCSRRVEKAIDLGRVDPRRPAFASHPVTPGGRDVAEAERQMIRLHDAAAIIGGHPDYAAPQAKIDAIAGILHSGRFSLLD